MTTTALSYKMNKPSLVLCILFLVNSLFTFIKANHLRQTQEEIPNLDSLLTGLSTSYDLLRNKLESWDASIKDTLSLTYFKSLE